MRGSASVEQVGLAALIALLLLAGIAAIASGGDVDAGRTLAGAIGRKISCAPRLPEPCRRHPLVPAYGWPLARLVRALAPAPLAEPGPGGLPLVPVDFRRCRRESCAVAAGPHLTASGRRTTAFTQVEDRRLDLGWVEVTYWLYRPGARLGAGRAPRDAGRRRRRRRHAASCSRTTRCWSRWRRCPAATTTSSRPASEPPWQWSVGGTYPGWSS